MRKIAALALMTAASPALAATGPFFTLRNTDFVVMVAFLLFVGALIYFKVPVIIGKMLDKRAEGIKADLDAARAIHDEARSLLASYDRKHREMQDQAAQIVAGAKREALAAADQAKADLKVSMARRLQAAEEQIASAEASAVKAVKDKAVAVAVAAAGDLLTRNMTAADKGGLIDAAIRDVEVKLH
jgi:F-type H+-transporting ATPase subunit b